MSLHLNLALMADYNQWMNNFFGSIMGTLNHILVGNIVWLKRFADHPAKLDSLRAVRKLEKPSPTPKTSVFFCNIFSTIKHITVDKSPLCYAKLKSMLA